MEEIELLKEHCKHKDCVYRFRFDNTDDFCGYCIIERKMRGCRISECDKYKKAGRRLRTPDYEWELIDDED